MTNKKIGLWSCVFILIGGMLGSAIFSLLGIAIYYAGPASILSWIIAAVIMAGYGLICAELSIRFPKSGGVYIFPKKAFSENKKKSELLSFISSCGLINANIVAIAFSAIYMGTYLSVGFPIFQDMQIPIAIITIILALILNCISFRMSGIINSILVITLIVTLAIYICISFFSGEFDTTYFTPFFSQGIRGELGFIKSVPIVMVAYGSIVSISFLVSEIKSPEKNIPTSIIIAMIFIVILYLLIVVSTLGLVNVQYLEENPGMRYIPLYAASFTKLSSYSFLPKIISIAACIAIFTTIFVVTSITSRTIQAMADNEIIPKSFAKNNRHNVPAFASLLVLFPAALISLFPSFTEMIVGLAALFAATTICINCISLIHVRKKDEKPILKYKTPLAELLPYLVLSIILICYIPDIMQGGYIIWVYSILWYAICFIFYFYRKKSGKINV